MHVYRHNGYHYKVNASAFLPFIKRREKKIHYFYIIKSGSQQRTLKRL